MLALTLVQTAFSGTWSPSAHTWGGSSTDQADSVAVDSSGNVYVAGSTESFGAGGQDVLITKYGPTGQFLWSRTWGGSSDEFATAVKVGPDGLLYVTGVTSSFGAGWFDLFLLQLDSNGKLNWGKSWGGQSYDGGHDIGFDANGNIYVVGESYSTGPCCTAVLLKFSTAGVLVQSSYYKGPATYDSGYSLAVDSSFNVIVTGISWDYSIPPLHNSILLLKYDPNGNLLWQENWATTFPGQDESWAFHDVTTDTANNIYIAGRHTSDCNNSNFGICDFDTLLIKLDQNGIFQWANTWGTTGTYDTAGSVLLNTAQAPMVAGMLDQYGTPLLFLLSYDATGNLLSETGWRGGNVQPGSAAGMASDASGALYLASSALNNLGSWSSTGANAGSLHNSLITNAYSAGVPSLSTTPLTSPTVDQSSVGVQDTGGGGADAFVVQRTNTATARFLSFPLLSRTASNAKIISVFDHSSNWQYCADNVVEAYDGETGEMQFGTDSEPTDPTCYLTKLPNLAYGFAQSDYQPFSVNGQYVGADGDGDGHPGSDFLEYDGHPGFDFMTKDQSANGKIPVLAAADGTVVCSNVPSPAKCTDTTRIDPCVEGPGEIKIRHSNGYFSIYLHLSSSIVEPGQAVSSQQQIGTSGDTGVCNNPHLHFEIRKGICGNASSCTCSLKQTENINNCIPVDPYGWSATKPDPYMHAGKPVKNIRLWK
jgi:murein DD-endopeptidase MepM/ murein hydrolase activator NlpD